MNLSIILNKDNLYTLTKDIFTIGLITYIVISLIEDFSPGFFSNYANLNIFLLAVIIVGTIVLLRNKEKKVKNKPFYKFLIISFGIFSAEVVYLKTIELGWIGLLIGLIAGIAIIYTSYLTLNEE